MVRRFLSGFNISSPADTTPFKIDCSTLCKAFIIWCQLDEIFSFCQQKKNHFFFFKNHHSPFFMARVDEEQGKETPALPIDILFFNLT